jgi:hypothetical protein
VEVHGKVKDVLKGSARKTTEQRLRYWNPKDSSSGTNYPLLALESSVDYIKNDFFPRNPSVAKSSDKGAKLNRDEDVDYPLQYH